jgi:hypothetical protein
MKAHVDDLLAEFWLGCSALVFVYWKHAPLLDLC